jgi:hypothetical protein
MFPCRSTVLELRRVTITNCSSQAIVLTGPGASLKAVDVIFESNTAQNTLGIVISAGQADVVLDRVTIKANKGAIRPPTAAAAHEYNPGCIDSSSTGSALPFPNASSHNSHNRLWPAACGAPALLSSLLDIQSSNLSVKNSVITENDADCVISAVGAAPQRLQLLQGTRARGNRVNWLLVADSWAADPTGRQNLMAPQPSPSQQQPLDMKPPYTTHDVMGGLKDLFGVGSSSNSSSKSSAGVAALQSRPLLLERFVGAAPAGQVRLAAAAQQQQGQSRQQQRH